MFLLGESQGQGSLVGCRLWGHTESDSKVALMIMKTMLKIQVKDWKIVINALWVYERSCIAVDCLEDPICL